MSAKMLARAWNMGVQLEFHDSPVLLLLWHQEMVQSSPLDFDQWIHPYRYQIGEKFDQAVRRMN